MSALTMQQVRAAQDNDLDAITAVITELEPRLHALVFKAARRMAHGGDRLAQYQDDFMQVARVAVWEAIPRFHGDTIDSFYAFIHRSVEGALKDAVREERNGGADRAAMKIYGAMLEKADGDPYLAEKFCQTIPPKGERLSADRAHAARLAWEGTLSLEAPARTADGPWDGAQIGSLVENIHSDYGVPEDLVTVEDRRRESDRVKHAVVNSILDIMGEKQRTVIRNSFGIAGCPCYGWGDNGDDYAMSRDIGMPVKHIRDARTKGLRSFAKKWVKVSAKSPEHARELEEAARINLGRAGRK